MAPAWSSAGMVVTLPGRPVTMFVMLSRDGPGFRYSLCARVTRLPSPASKVRPPNAEDVGSLPNLTLWPSPQSSGFSGAETSGTGPDFALLTHT
jgi:hypothetical protein